MTADPMIRAFHAEGRPRVWSLIVTIMGDMALPRGGRMPVSVMADILRPLGISESALRTALSRLTQDGWMMSARDGRKSLYRLTPKALAETNAASKLIYAPPLDQRLWRLGLGPVPKGAVQLKEGWVFHGVPKGRALTFADGPLQGCGHGLLRPDHERALQDMACDLAACEQSKDALTERLLLIHRWRRLCLRHAEVPAAFDPGSSEGLRADVARAYHALWSQSEEMLTRLGAPPTADDAPTTCRFRPDTH